MSDKETVENIQAPEAGAVEPSAGSACYICGEPKTFEWYSVWYDGESRKICSLMCREQILEMWEKNPKKRYQGTYSQRYNTSVTGGAERTESDE